MSKRVLIVDDSRVSRMMIKARMQALQPDWTYDEAASGDDALQQATAQPPDFVTMDMNMPGLNGFDAAERLCVTAPQARVVMLTANIQESSRERAAAIGVKFLQKPVTESAIQQAIDYFQAPA